MPRRGHKSRLYMSAWRKKRTGASLKEYVQRRRNMKIIGSIPSISVAGTNNQFTASNIIYSEANILKMDENKLQQIKLEVEETPNEMIKFVDPERIKNEDSLCVEFKVEIKEEPEDSSDEIELNTHENFDYISSENSSLADDTLGRQSTNIIPFRTCFVPKCTNTTNKTPDKNFIHVPLITEVRNAWFQVARRIIPNSDKSNYFCCEDHFNLEEDAENYMKHKLTGCSIRMKKYVVPHIFDCQQSRKRSRSPPSPLSETLNRKRLVKDAKEEIHKNISQTVYSSTPGYIDYYESNSSTTGPTRLSVQVAGPLKNMASQGPVLSQPYQLIKKQTSSIGIQTIPGSFNFISKGTTCNPSVADRSLSPIIFETRDMATSPIIFDEDDEDGW